MGLDMYLKAKKSIYRPWGDTPAGENGEQARANEALRQEIRKLLGLEAFTDNNFDSVEITVDAAYWRKANQIHKWFVDNVQEGEDKCQESYVSREQLIELRNACSQALLMHDASPLPLQEGPFFGSNVIDEWYWESLRGTLEQINKVLKAFTQEDGWEFYYQASW